MAIRRFVGRRGCPKELHSDNGTNFHGADNELRKALEDFDQIKIVEELTKRGIIWRFLPPSSPFMGGAWERLVRSVKIALKTTLKERAPREEVLQTLFVEAENIVNSRPLTPVSTDWKDEESLTPNHFLIGSSNGTPAPGVFSDTDLCLRKQWRIAQCLADHFWKRWMREYLPTLTRRKKWLKSTPPLKIGDLVFIADGNAEKNNWPRGRIIEVFPGKDGKIRVVDAKTQNGVLRRPVAKLFVIDVGQEVVDDPRGPSLGVVCRRNLEEPPPLSTKEKREAEAKRCKQNQTHSSGARGSSQEK